jgi:sulfoxide reductase heme-binding subunit YedZ
LLTVSVVLGVLGPLRVAWRPRWPRFAIDSLHRDCSLLVIAMIVVHVITSVLDGFAPISLLDAVIPFRSPYRPLWLGLGAVAFDLLLALAITSLVRRRLGYRAWRAVHWLAYVSWPVAVLHGLGTGTDTKAFWNLLLTAACVGAVLVAVWYRIDRARPLYGGMREAALALAFATPLGLAIFAIAGPLQHGWARHAGTPGTLLGRAGTTSATRTALSVPPPKDFSAQLNGTINQTVAAGGAIIDLNMRFSGGAAGRLRVRMGGVPIEGGGLSMTGSQVVLQDGPWVMEGQISSLEGQQFVARVRAGNASLDLQANLQIDTQANTVSGTLQASSNGGA